MLQLAARSSPVLTMQNLFPEMLRPAAQLLLEFGRELPLFSIADPKSDLLHRLSAHNEISGRALEPETLVEGAGCVAVYSFEPGAMLHLSMPSLFGCRLLDQYGGLAYQRPT